MCKGSSMSIDCARGQKKRLVEATTQLLTHVSRER